MCLEHSVTRDCSAASPTHILSQFARSLCPIERPKNSTSRISYQLEVEANARGFDNVISPVTATGSPRNIEVIVIGGIASKDAAADVPRGL